MAKGKAIIPIKQFRILEASHNELKRLKSHPRACRSRSISTQTDRVQISGAKSVHAQTDCRPLAVLLELKSQLTSVDLTIRAQLEQIASVSDKLEALEQDLGGVVSAEKRRKSDEAIDNWVESLLCTADSTDEVEDVSHLYVDCDSLKIEEFHCDSVVDIISE